MMNWLLNLFAKKPKAETPPEPAKKPDTQIIGTISLSPLQEPTRYYQQTNRRTPTSRPAA